MQFSTQVKKVLKPSDLRGRNSPLALSASQIYFLRGQMVVKRTGFDRVEDSDQDSEDDGISLPDLIER